MGTQSKTALTMGYFEREDIPFYYALADAFTVCDSYHCSIFGPTDPNRLSLFTGTSGLSVGNPGPHVTTNIDDNNTADSALDDPSFGVHGWTTYAERLQQAGIDSAGLSGIRQFCGQLPGLLPSIFVVSTGTPSFIDALVPGWRAQRLKIPNSPTVNI